MIAIASQFASEHKLPIGKLVDAHHTPAIEYEKLGVNPGHGNWLVCFHYVGPLTPPHPKVTLRMDVGWLLCVLINDVTGEPGNGRITGMSNAGSARGEKRISGPANEGGQGPAKQVPQESKTSPHSEPSLQSTWAAAK